MTEPEPGDMCAVHPDVPAVGRYTVEQIERWPGGFEVYTASAPLCRPCSEVAGVLTL